MLLGLVAAHILALHEVGSNNPDGVEIKKHKDPRRPSARRHPVPSVLHGEGHRRRRWCSSIVFCVVVFFAPEMGGYFLEYNNFIPADPLKTPAHIAPVWYFTPYYSILRAVPPLFNSQFPACWRWASATMILFFLPWLDRSPVKSIRYRGALLQDRRSALFVVAFLVLGYLGTEPTTVWGQFGERCVSAQRRSRHLWRRASARVALLRCSSSSMPWYTAIDKVQAGARAGD